jgi:hypothetical protein
MKPQKPLGLADSVDLQRDQAEGLDAADEEAAGDGQAGDDQVVEHLADGVA